MRFGQASAESAARLTRERDRRCWQIFGGLRRELVGAQRRLGRIGPSLWPKGDRSLTELLRRTYTSNCLRAPTIELTLL